MRKHTEEEPPPRPTDLEGWRRAISEGRFRTFKMETVIAAIQDLGPNADKVIINSLVLHASDTILRVLRRHIGTNHRNQGEDIVEEAHDQTHPGDIHAEFCGWKRATRSICSKNPIPRSGCDPGRQGNAKARMLR